ncbi:MAG: hypothetical protein H6746_03795 [Deltaproteobacteria bacterium]|nr:hypothetical protein [Deltaproteobacteria bacterium]
MAALALAMLSLGACGGGEGAGPDGGGSAELPDATGGPDDGVALELGPEVTDAAPDVPAEVGPEVADDALDAGPDAPARTRRFVQEPTGLGTDFVYKGVWAGEAGRLVAVGNDGVVVARDPDGTWRRLSQGGGNQLLNAISGTDAGHLWAVGKDGAVLQGGTGGFGAGGGCATAADCQDDDPCTDATCQDGLCVVSSSGGAGCCGTTLASWNFDQGTASGFTQLAQTGGLKWQPVSHIDPLTGQARYTSAPSALYFGDPSKPLPDFDTGQAVAATIASPTVLLPKSGRATLHFQVFLDAEASPSFHLLTLEVASGQTVQTVWSKASLPTVPTPGFVPVTVDLSAWRGAAVSLRFRFDSVVSSFNFGEGVYLDDIVIDSTCEQSVDLALPTLFGVAAVAPDDVWAVGLAGAIAHFDGASWHEVGGGPPLVTWNAMHGAGDRVVVVGSSGAIAVSDGGGGLVPAESPTAFTLRGVHSADGVTFWAVGDGGTLIRGEGEDWSLVSVPTSANLHAVVALAPTDAYAVGDGGTVLHYDGAIWSLLTALPAAASKSNLRSVTSAGLGQVLIAGNSGLVMRGSADIGFVADPVFIGVGELDAGWNQGDVSIVVGEDSQIFRDDGTGWALQDVSSTQHLRAVWGASPDDVWVVGLGGIMLHWDGSAWEVIQTTLGSLETLWGRAADDIYAAGHNGTIVHYDGEYWSLAATRTTEHLRGVFGRPGGQTWAVGGAGVVMKRSELGWVRAPVQPIPVSDGSQKAVTNTMHAVWGAAEDDVWAVGAEGQILHWDGQTWSSKDPRLGVTLRGVYGLAADDVWAVGNEGQIVHWDGAEWTPWPSGSVATLYGIHGDGQGQVYVVGDLGTVLRLEVSD